MKKTKKKAVRRVKAWGIFLNGHLRFGRISGDGRTWREAALFKTKSDAIAAYPDDRKWNPQQVEVRTLA